jgi:hypothetical protein
LIATLKHGCFDMSIDDLIQIVRNGGGLELQIGGFTTPQLVQLVSNASTKSTIILHGASGRTPSELVQISANVGGSVIFDLS